MDHNTHLFLLIFLCSIFSLTLFSQDDTVPPPVKFGYEKSDKFKNLEKAIERNIKEQLDITNRLIEIAIDSTARRDERRLATAALKKLNNEVSINYLLNHVAHHVPWQADNESESLGTYPTVVALEQLTYPNMMSYLLVYIRQCRSKSEMGRIRYIVKNYLLKTYGYPVAIFNYDKRVAMSDCERKNREYIKDYLGNVRKQIDGN